MNKWFSTDLRERERETKGNNGTGKKEIKTDENKSGTPRMNLTPLRKRKRKRTQGFEKH